MLTEERHSKIIEFVNRQKTATVLELCSLLDTSESTVRRDLNILDKSGLIKKVRGGAISVSVQDSFTTLESNVEEKSHLYIAEKTAIAKYAAGLIEDGDFVFIDAGTTTEKMIDYLPSKQVTFVTNAFTNAKKLAQHGFKVFLTGGKIKLSTEAVVGAQCVQDINSYNFTKSFLGANGISLSAGVTTPDRNEASVKEAVISNSRNTYILADHSKFDKITSVTFATLEKVTIITDRVIDNKYLNETTIKEVI